MLPGTRGNHGRACGCDIMPPRRIGEDARAGIPAECIVEFPANRVVD